MRKLFIFTEYYTPAENSTSLYITKIVEVAKGSFEGEIRVFCATLLPDDENQSDDETNKFHVCRIAPGRAGKNNLMQRLWKFTRVSAIFSILAIWFLRRGNVVFAVTNPAFIIFVLAALRKCIGFNYILLAFDIFPENLVAANLATESSLKYRFSKVLFDWAYRSADQVVSIGRDMSKILKSKGVDEKRISFIPNWADCQRIRPLPRSENNYLEKLGLQDNFVFLFAGNIGRVQGIENLLEGIDLVSRTRAAFLFVGSGAKASSVLEFQAARPGKHIHCTGELAMTEQSSFLNACDVAIVTLGTNMLGLGVPSKSYFSMAAGKPLLYVGDKESEIGQLIRQEGIGWVVEPDQPLELARRIDVICDLPKEQITALGVRSRGVAEMYFSEEAAVLQYSQLFRQQNRIG